LFSPEAQVARLPVAKSGDSPRDGSIEQEVIGFFDRMRDRLLRYVLTMRLSVSDGEEVVQDTFLALYEHLRAGRPRENLDAWLFRVAHNFALKRLRKPGLAVESLEESGAAIRDPGLDPEAELVQGRSQRAVEAVIRALPEQDRQCLLLRTEGLRYREIAETLGMSLGAVSLAITRAIEKIARVAER
jgi:RNA polymerase sigma-70 factor (ECF subfamily)